MIQLFEKLYEFAEVDLKAAKLLGENKLYPPAIYHYQQVLEKCNKSIIACYLSLIENKSSNKVENELLGISHKVTEATVNVISNLINFDRELYVKRGGRDTDDFIQRGYKAAKSLTDHVYAEIELISLFPGIVIKTYQIAFLRLKEERYFDSKEKEWDYLRKTFENKETSYLKYNTIAWIISPVLERMDLNTRYPRKSVNYLNLKMLSHRKGDEACRNLEEMLGELYTLVPSVWNRIKSMSKSK